MANLLYVIHDTFTSMEHGKFDFYFCHGKNTLHPRNFLSLSTIHGNFASINYGRFTLQNMAITTKQKIVHFCFCSTWWQFLIHIFCLFNYIVKIAYKFLMYISCHHGRDAKLPWTFFFFDIGIKRFYLPWKFLLVKIMAIFLLQPIVIFLVMSCSLFYISITTKIFLDHFIFLVWQI